MKNHRWLAPVLIALGVAMSSGCVVRGRLMTGVVVEVEEEPPPPRVVVITPRSGHIWVDGRWDRRGGQWVWVDGYYERERRNEHWVAGHWEKRGRKWVWRQGHWKRGNGHGNGNRDHRDNGGPASRDHRR